MSAAVEYVEHERELARERARTARTASLRVLWLAADAQLGRYVAELRRQDAGELVALTRARDTESCNSPECGIRFSA